MENALSEKQIAFLNKQIEKLESYKGRPQIEKKLNNYSAWLDTLGRYKHYCSINDIDMALNEIEKLVALYFPLGDKDSLKMLKSMLKEDLNYEFNPHDIV